MTERQQSTGKKSEYYWNSNNSIYFRPKFIIQERKAGIKVTTTLAIKNVSYEDFGKYRCNAINFIANSNAEIMLYGEGFMIY